MKKHLSDYPPLPSIYATDDYPREGCKLVIKITKRGYSMTVRGPGGRPLEGYGATMPRQLGRIIAEWCEGKAPRRNRPEDQPASVSIGGSCNEADHAD